MKIQFLSEDLAWHEAIDFKSLLHMSQFILLLYASVVSDEETKI